MSTSYDINGIGGVSGVQDAYAPQPGQASKADIRIFEQHIEALLQELQARNSASGAGQQNVMQTLDGGGGAQGGGSAAPASGVSGGNALSAGDPQSIAGNGLPGGRQSQDTVQVLEQVAKGLLQALENQSGVQRAGGGAQGSATSGGSAPGDGAAAPTGAATGNSALGTPAQVTPPPDQSGMNVTGGNAPAGQDLAAAPATQQANAEPGGATMSVDGAKPGGDTVTMQVVNNTGKDEKVVLTNSQNQKFADVDLRPGEKENLLLDPNDSNTKSARMQTTNPNDSLRQDPKLTEFNLQPSHTAINVSNNNFAGITDTNGNQVDSLQMKVDDGQGKVAGDGAANGSYRNSVDDANAMIMGDDPSKNFIVTMS